MKTSTPQQQLDGFIDKFSPEIASQVRIAMARLLARLPGAMVLVYDNYNALAIGFGPGERVRDAIFSLAVYPRWISLFFLKDGTRLPDPGKLLKGRGRVVRHLVLDSPDTLELPAVKALIREALRRASPPIDPARPSRLIIKSVSVKQRPRRPPQKT